MTGKRQRADDAKLLLLMIRCGFMGDRRALTRKGRGLFPEWVWEAYVRVRCELDGRFRGRVLAILTDAIRRERELLKMARVMNHARD
jgi:hypothetical protein